MEARIRELERQLGRKTLEAEILKEALEKTRFKKPTFLASRLDRTVHDEGGGAILGVSRSNLQDQAYEVLGLSPVALMRISARHITASSSVFILTVAAELGPTYGTSY